MHRILLQSLSLSLALLRGLAEFLALQRSRLQDWLLQQAR